MAHGDGASSTRRPTHDSVTSHGSGPDRGTYGPEGTGQNAVKPPRRRLSPRRILVLSVIVGLVGMWGYVLYLAFGPGRQPPVDRLDDPAFAEAAEVRCADALSQVDQLQLATEAESAAERAEVVDDANQIFESMLDDLDDTATLAPQGDQRSRVEAWLTDWRIYLGDRQVYADALRVDPGARLLISEKPGAGRHITGWIDEFARANRMPSCASPTDA